MNLKVNAFWSRAAQRVWARRLPSVFQQGGAAVVITARSAPVEKTDHYFIQADGSTLEARTKVTQEILNRFHGVDIIIHNVGGSSAPSGGFITATEEIWQQNLNENLLSAVRLDRALLPSMLERGWGVIIHISSIQRTLPLYDSTSHTPPRKPPSPITGRVYPTKLVPRGIRVNTVSPGFIETDAATRMIPRMADKDKARLCNSRQKLMDMLGGIPLGVRNRPTKSQN